MNYYIALIFIVSLLLSSCANPLNQATANRYSNQCSEAEQAGRLDIAEETCYRALVNVDWGNLGKEEKSKHLYNLARIKARLGKLNEAEALHLESIDIEKELSSTVSEKLGRRYVELSAVYLIMTKLADGRIEDDRLDPSLGKDKLDEGVKLLTEMKSIAGNYRGKEHEAVVNIYEIYSEELRLRNQTEKAEEFANISRQL